MCTVHNCAPQRQLVPALKLLSNHLNFIISLSARLSRSCRRWVDSGQIIPMLKNSISLKLCVVVLHRTCYTVEVRPALICVRTSASSGPCKTKIFLTFALRAKDCRPGLRAMILALKGPTSLYVLHVSVWIFIEVHPNIWFWVWSPIYAPYLSNF